MAMWCLMVKRLLDAQVTAQDVYIGMLENARKYCWIMTPYLIIDNDMNNALIRAARRGVDVRILLPGIPDKKTIWNISKSFAQRLIHGGVKIYLYQPGFVHAKVFVSDDVCAAVGTINLDYRSLYLHFENGTYLTGAKEVLKIKEDCADSFAQGELLDAMKAVGNPFKALLEMLKTRSLDSINIGEITEKAQVSRNSFYRNFASKEDIIRQRIMTYLNEWHMQTEAEHFDDPKQIFCLLFEAAEKHKDFFLLLRDAGLPVSAAG